MSDYLHNLDTVARHMVYAAVLEACTSGPVTWENYPDLTEGDFSTAAKQALDLAISIVPDSEIYDAAYKRLAQRAEAPDVKP